MENKIERKEIENKIEPINNYEIIFFYKSSKENILRQNNYIDYLMSNILESNSNREY